MLAGSQGGAEQAGGVDGADIDALTGMGFTRAQALQVCCCMVLCSLHCSPGTRIACMLCTKARWLCLRPARLQVHDALTSCYPAGPGGR